MFRLVTNGAHFAIVFVLCLAWSSACSDGSELGDTGGDAEVGHDADADIDDGEGILEDTNQPPDMTPVDAEIETPVDAEIEPAGPLLGEISVVENPLNMLSYFVEWTTTRPVVTDLWVDCPDLLDQRYSGTNPRTDHQVFLAGLAQGASCKLTIRAVDEIGPEEQQELMLEVGVFPTGFLPTVTLEETENTESMQPGWTLLPLFDSEEHEIVVFAMLDELGRYRWYHRRRGWDSDLTVIPAGLLVGSFNEFGALILDWDGTVRWESPFLMHHDVRPSPFNDDHLLYLGASREGCPEETSEVTVNEFDLLANETIWSWNVCEHYTPPRIYRDWSHINTVEPFPGERALLISSRDQNRLWKIDRDTGEIIWTLGEGGDFEMEPEDRFLLQHSPEIQPGGTILLFDNGHSSLRPYSRAIEFELTFTNTGEPESASVIWEYVDTDIFSRNMSDADRLPNGNTLITYGSLPESRNSILLEVAPDGAEVWKLVTGDNWTVYRSERVVEPFLGEVR